METMNKSPLALTPLFLLATVITFAAEESLTAIQKQRLDDPLFKSSLEFLKTPVPIADSTATAETEMKPYTEKIPGTEVVFKMVPIKGGKFLMGSPEDEEGRLDDEGPQHEVELKPFWMEEHETTWKEFEQFAMTLLRLAHAQNPSVELSPQEKIADAMACPTRAWNPGVISYDQFGKPGYPASGITVYAAQVYCKWLTTLTGRYYRLPTEAEWEYACRAGSASAFSFGDDADDIDDYAWHFDNTDGEGYKKVKQKKPNAWGLYDMHGNVAEWVLEQYSPDTYKNRKSDMFGAPIKKPSGSGFGQVARGGSCDNDDMTNLRSARRLYSVPQWKEQDPQFPKSIWWMTDAAFVGFRIVRPLEPPKTEEEAKLYEPDPKVWFDYAELNSRQQ